MVHFHLLNVLINLRHDRVQVLKLLEDAKAGKSLLTASAASGSGGKRAVNPSPFHSATVRCNTLLHI